jgi:hypothetical protein
MSGFDLAATMNEQVRSANERAAIAEYVVSPTRACAPQRFFCTFNCSEINNVTHLWYRQDERRGHEQRVNEILKVLISAEAQAVSSYCVLRTILL